MIPCGAMILIRGCTGGPQKVKDFALKDLVKVLNSKSLKMNGVTWRLGPKGCADKIRGKCGALRSCCDEWVSPKVACVALLIICHLCAFLVIWVVFSL